MSYLCRHTSITINRQTGSFQGRLRAATALFRRFHRFPPSLTVSQPCDRVIPKVLVRLGELKALVYSSDRGKPGRNRSFIHFLETPPTLACDPSGRRLFILGGKYRVTPFGIEG